MKKSLMILLFIGIFIASGSPAYAYRYPVFHNNHHHAYRSTFGIGIISGVIAANLFYRPPAAVIIEPACPVVARKSPVIIERSHSPVSHSEIVDNWVSVNTPILNVRSGPGLKFSVIGHIYEGDLLTIKGNSPQWIYVRLPDGNFGWVMAEYTS